MKNSRLNVGIELTQEQDGREYLTMSGFMLQGITAADPKIVTVDSFGYRFPDMPDVLDRGMWIREEIVNACAELANYVINHSDPLALESLPESMVQKMLMADRQYNLLQQVTKRRSIAVPSGLYLVDDGA